MYDIHAGDPPLLISALVTVVNVNKCSQLLPLLDPIAYIDQTVIYDKSVIAGTSITKSRLFKYIENFTTKKTESFQIDIRKIMYTPVNPSFSIKVGFKGVNII